MRLCYVTDRHMAICSRALRTYILYYIWASSCVCLCAYHTQHSLADVRSVLCMLCVMSKKKNNIIWYAISECAAAYAKHFACIAMTTYVHVCDYTIQQFAAPLSKWNIIWDSIDFECTARHTIHIVFVYIVYVSGLEWLCSSMQFWDIRFASADAGATNYGWWNKVHTHDAIITHHPCGATHVGNKRPTKYQWAK